MYMGKQAEETKTEVAKSISLGLYGGWKVI
jgi:hypothetical protein